MVDFLTNAFIELLLVMAILLCIITIYAIISTFIGQLKENKRKEEALDQFNEALESIINECLTEVLEEEKENKKTKKNSKTKED
jgi:Na+-translocating ferredoxin:NAD+ oxidoreductase RnfG subunit